MPTRDPDSLLGSETGPEVEHKVQGSRFLGQVLAASTVEEARDHLAEVRRRYHDATHHGSAWRVGHEPEPEERFDDDGEPSGTTGVPILGAIRRAERTDTLVVVTRWYGGTKLGTGGLARAYGEAARLAVEAAPIRILWRERRLRVRFAYDDLGAVEGVLARSSETLRHVERRFDPDPCLLLTVKESRADALGALLVETTAGRATVEDL
jgi:uncharacterized YigZ family protein